MSHITTGGGFALDTPKDIEAYRLLALKGALKLEIFGIKSRFNVAESVRSVMGSTNKRKEKLLAEYETWLRDKGILIGEKDHA